MNRVKNIYGGTTPEEIAEGTEKRIESMALTTLSEPLRKALELQPIIAQFDKMMAEMDADLLRRKYSQDELEQAIENRRLHEEYLEKHNLTLEDLQTAMQRLTWDASADAKACQSLTESLPTAFKNRVKRASKFAYEACCSSQSRSKDDGDDLVLDVGCGYGVVIPAGPVLNQTEAE